MRRQKTGTQKDGSYSFNISWTYELDKMTIPSNNTFYEWGYHDPGKDPVLPLSDEQREIFERVIAVSGGTVEVGYQLLPSWRGI